MSDTEKYEELRRKYQATVSMTSGCGARGQFYVDSAYEEWSRFCEEHPGFKLPRNEKVFDDGAAGTICGLATMNEVFNDGAAGPPMGYATMHDERVTESLLSRVKMMEQQRELDKYQ